MGDPEARDAPASAGLYGWLTRKFRRVTSSGRYIPEVDGLRFVAIASVFFFHLRAFIGIKSSTPWVVPYQEDWLGRLAHVGNAGVPLFFMISGFILGLPFASHWLKGTEPISLRAYFLRRLTRLEPPYLISLTVFFILLRVVNGTPWRQLVPGYITSFFYLHTLLGRPDDTINAVAWSLEVEVQFYILAPLLALVFAVRGPVARRSLLVTAAYAAAVAQWFFTVDETLLKDTLLNYIQFFLAGFLMADLYLVEFGGPTAPDRASWRGTLWDAAGVGVVLALLRVLPDPLTAHFATPALFPALMASAFRGRAMRWAFSRPWLTAIGGMCYSIYLIHYQVISLVGRFTKDLPFSRHFWVNLLVQSIVVGLPTLVLSSVFFLLVEKPCMRKDWPARLLAWLRDNGRRARAGTAVESR
jgi:peptidoglycan/LPS O-acetylase OafA/YrhL